MFYICSIHQSLVLHDSIRMEDDHNLKSNEFCYIYIYIYNGIVEPRIHVYTKVKNIETKQSNKRNNQTSKSKIQVYNMK